ncbi:diguanylate cyclase domain-containing protein, partial [Roseateles sp. GG27B]
MAWIGVVDWRQATGSGATAGDACFFLDTVKDRLALNDDPLLTNMMSVRAVREKKVVVCNDLRIEPENIFGPERQASGILSLAFLPLMIGDDIHGLLALYAEEAGFFVDEEMQLLTELAGDIGFAMDHIGKEERLHYLAYYDDLTGLPNLSMFLEQVSQRLRLRSGDNSSLALALLEIDRFPIINETLGSKTGQDLLKLLVQRLQGSNIGFDFIACVEPNCFAVVLLDANNAQNVVHRLEQLLHACFDQAFFLGGTDLRIAGKLGVAMYPNDCTEAEGLYRNAEKALKRTKGSIEPLLFYSPEMNIRVAAVLNLESR